MLFFLYSYLNILSEQKLRIECLQSLMHSIIENMNNAQLLQNFSSIEIVNTVSDEPIELTRTRWFQVGFYQNHWNVVEPGVYAAVK